MIKYKVDDIIANITAQLHGYKQNIDEHNINPDILVEVIEFLVNETSKLKSIILELHTTESVN